MLSLKQITNAFAPASYSDVSKVSHADEELTCLQGHAEASDSISQYEDGKRGRWGLEAVPDDLRQRACEVMRIEERRRALEHAPITMTYTNAVASE